VLLLTLTGLGIIKFAIVATLLLEMLLAIVAELNLIAMDESLIISKVILIN
jgi:hypothetical protein